MRRVFSCSLLLAALVLAGCGGQDRTQASSESSAAAQASAASAGASNEAASAAAAVSAAAQASVPPTATAGPTAIPSPGAGEFVNPVINLDFPDPDVLKVGDTYYAYATNAGGTNVQTATSKDLAQWQQIGEALPALPLWATTGFTWAPEVTTTADGSSYVMYFTARDTASNYQCIGVATSDKPEGPFTSTAEQAFICPVDQGGAIDAASFKDEDGTNYILWKNDGNCCSIPTRLYVQKVSADGLTLDGEPIKMVENDLPWEGSVTEAPTLWKRNGKYHLFYSANNYAGIDYAVGHAVSDQIGGPYTKTPDPVLRTDPKVRPAPALGPGGQDIIVDKDGDTWMMYHTWNAEVTARYIMIDELTWEGDTPVIKGPDRVPQPLP